MDLCHCFYSFNLTHPIKGYRILIIMSLCWFSVRKYSTDWTPRNTITKHLHAAPKQGDLEEDVCLATTADVAYTTFYPKTKIRLSMIYLQSKPTLPADDEGE